MNFSFGLIILAIFIFSYIDIDYIYSLTNLNQKPHIWSQTGEYPDFIPWRISKNLPIYNETSFY